MDGEVIRGVGHALGERRPEALRRVGGEARDEIHVDVGEARVPDLTQAAADFLRRVAAADGLEHPVVHALGVDADAIHSPAAEDLQLLRRHGVRPPGLHGDLPAAGEVEGILKLAQKAIHLLGREGRGGAAAHVEGVDGQAQLPEHPPPCPDLLRQGGEIGLDEGEGLLHAGADEGAVGAAGGAEGDAKVEVDVPLLQAPLLFEAGFRGLGGQAGPPGGDEVALLQEALGVRQALALPEALRRQLAGADAGEGAPGGRHAGEGAVGFKEAPAQGPAALAFPLIVRAGEGGFHRLGDGLPVPAQAGLGAAVGVVPLQAHLRPAAVRFRVNGPIGGALLGEEGQKSLLDDIPAVVAGTVELHFPLRMA